LGVKRFLQRSHIDFAGDRLEVVDEMKRKIKKAEAFIAILPVTLKERIFMVVYRISILCHSDNK
jgi:hypothetical protein